MNWKLFIDGVEQHKFSWLNYGGWARQDYSSWAIESVKVDTKKFIVNGSATKGYSVLHDHANKIIKITIKGIK